MRVVRLPFLCFLLMLISTFGHAADVVRVGVLQYGTLNWEMDVIQQTGLEQQAGVQLDIVSLASPQALLVALQSNRVDVVLNDWLWVAQQRDMGRRYYFSPYSSNAGALVVNPAAGIDSLPDLAGKTIGIAGGRTNKNWVLFSTYIKQQTGLELGRDIAVKFAAPPMLNALLEQGKLDGVINFWHYAAQLNAQGMPTIITMQQLLTDLGVDGNVPLLGWVFSEQFAKAHQPALQHFLAMSESARTVMASNNALWQTLPSFTRYPQESQPYLQRIYQAGIITSLPDSVTQLQQVFTLLKNHEGNDNITGTLTELPHDLLWPND